MIFFQDELFQKIKLINRKILLKMLAIVIPYYKVRFFESTLESLSLQTDKRFKVYIGNDCSMDDPLAILEKYKDKLDIEYQYFEANLGSVSLTQQWERCTAMVENEDWVMILGDDDVIGPNSVVSFYENIGQVNEQKINVIRYATVVIDQNDKELSVIHTHPQYEKSTDFFNAKI